LEISTKKAVNRTIETMPTLDILSKTGHPVEGPVTLFDKAETLLIVDSVKMIEGYGPNPIRS